MLSGKRNLVPNRRVIQHISQDRWNIGEPIRQDATRPYENWNKQTGGRNFANIGISKIGGRNFTNTRISMIGKETSTQVSFCIFRFCLNQFTIFANFWNLLRRELFSSSIASDLEIHFGRWRLCVVSFFRIFSHSFHHHSCINHRFVGLHFLTPWNNTLVQSLVSLWCRLSP